MANIYEEESSLEPRSFRTEPAARLCIGEKKGIKKDRKIFICNKEITVYMNQYYVVPGSSPGEEAVIKNGLE